MQNIDWVPHAFKPQKLTRTIGASGSHTKTVGASSSHTPENISAPQAETEKSTSLNTD